jgi:hypothetical protein
MIRGSEIEFVWETTSVLGAVTRDFNMVIKLSDRNPTNLLSAANALIFDVTTRGVGPATSEPSGSPPLEVRGKLVFELM